MATLYENLKLLCDQRGIKPGKMCVDIGASKSLMTGLKAGRTKSINAETAQKIADYFGVSVDYILNGPDAVLHSAAQDAVVNREFAELPIETRAAMLQGIKKDAPTGNADERDGIKKAPAQTDGGLTEAQRQAMQFVMSLPPEKLERVGKMGRAAFEDET